MKWRMKRRIKGRKDEMRCDALGSGHPREKGKKALKLCGGREGLSPTRWKIRELASILLSLLDTYVQ